MWKKNRFLSVTLAGTGMMFWLCLRDLSGRFSQFPFLSVVCDPLFQSASFLIMGFALAWSFHAWKPEPRMLMWLGPVGAGIIYVLFQTVYDSLFGRKARYYPVNPWLQLTGICMGAALAGLLMWRTDSGLISDSPDTEISLTPISTYRSELMGVGILGVVLVHARNTLPRLVLPLDAVMCLGSSGVDIFLFVSGIGMVYSLVRDPDTRRFYKRRARRIFLEAMPWVAALSILLFALGKYSVWDVLINCLGIGNLVPGQGFNWFLSFILLFYLTTPLLFRMLRRDETRWPVMALLLSLDVLLILLLNDVLNMPGKLRGFSRLPVFLVGMAAGFWLKQGRALTRPEYRSMIPVSLLFFCMAYMLSKLKLSEITASMWLCYCVAAPVFCLALSRAFTHAGSEGYVMRFLRWSGENSLLLYVWNIILQKFNDLFFGAYIDGTGAITRWLYTCALVALNYLIVWLISRAKDALRRRRA